MVRENIKEYTVTEISASIKETLEDNFGYVKVRGEVSGLSKPASGHVYLNLKDENAIIKAKHAGDLINWKYPCLADDSGLSIKILSNKPGVYSARWVKKNNYTNVFKYIRNKIEAKGEEMPGQKAFFNCTLALLYSPSKVIEQLPFVLI